MRQKPTILLLIALFCALSAHAETVVILKGRSIQLYDRVEADFIRELTRQYLRKAEKTISPLRFESYDLSTINRFPGTLSNNKPDLLFAIGGAALANARTLGGSPVVAVLAVEDKQAGAKPLIAGVNVIAPAARWLEAAAPLLQAGRRVGVVVGEGAPDAWLIEARGDAAKRGVQLVEATASSPDKVRQALFLLKGRVDLLFLVPDLRIITKESIDEILLYGAENSLPVVAFSQKYLKTGAALTIEPDLDFLGEQAAAIAEGILNDTYRSERIFVDAARCEVNFNPEILGRLGIPFPKSPAHSGSESK